MPKLNPVRVPLRQLPPHTRAATFDEIALGYTAEEAAAEAARCILYPHPQCLEGCPTHNRIPEFIRALQQGNLAGAAAVLETRTSFPSICSRVCDQSKQCEGNCAVGKRGRPVASARSSDTSSATGTVVRARVRRRGWRSSAIAS